MNAPALLREPALARQSTHKKQAAVRAVGVKVPSADEITTSLLHFIAEDMRRSRSPHRRSSIFCRLICITMSGIGPRSAASSNKLYDNLKQVRQLAMRRLAVQAFRSPLILTNQRR
jgi:hypothetical protein